MPGAALPTSTEDSQPISASRRRLVNIGHLLTGNVANACIILVSQATAARALGPAAYGIMVLVLAFGRSIERFVRFESWQPLVRFIAQEGDGDESDKGRLAQLYAYGLALDVGSALIAGALTLLLSTLAGPFFGIDQAHLTLVSLYSIAIFLNVTGMPSAVLRVSGKFKMIAYGQLLANLLRIVLAQAAFWMGAGLKGFMIVWTICQVFGVLIFLFMSFSLLHEQGIRLPIFVSLKGVSSRFPGFMSFAWSTNISTMLRTITTEADVLLIGTLTGSASAGFYFLAKRIAKVANQLSQHIQMVIYPDVAKMWAKGKYAEFKKTNLQVQFALAGIGLAALAGCWLVGEFVIRFGLGTAYLEAFPMLITQMVAVVLLMHAAPSRSALLSMGQASTVMWVALVGTVVFLATALVVVPIMGAVGGNIAHIVLGAVSAVLLDYFWLRHYRRHANDMVQSSG